jgi:hypothetical protein
MRLGPGATNAGAANHRAAKENAMAKPKLPARPKTPDHEAIVALEHVVLLLLTRHARATDQSILEKARRNLVTQLPEATPDRALVVDHMDWIFARVQTAMRHQDEEKET